jgi:hypothetical protein
MKNVGSWEECNWFKPKESRKLGASLKFAHRTNPLKRDYRWSVFAYSAEYMRHPVLIPAKFLMG